MTTKPSHETTIAILFLSFKVSRRLGNVFYMMNLPLSVPLPPAPGKPPEQPPDIASPLRCNSSGDVLDSPCSQGLETSKTVEQIVSESREHPCDADGPQADFQMIAFQKSWAGPRTRNVSNNTGAFSYQVFERVAAAWNLCMGLRLNETSCIVLSGKHFKKQDYILVQLLSSAIHRKGYQYNYTAEICQRLRVHSVQLCRLLRNYQEKLQPIARVGIRFVWLRKWAELRTKQKQTAGRTGCRDSHILEAAAQSTLPLCSPGQAMGHLSSAAYSAFSIRDEVTNFCSLQKCAFCSLLLLMVNYLTANMNHRVRFVAREISPAFHNEPCANYLYSLIRGFVTRCSFTVHWNCPPPPSLQENLTLKGTQIVLRKLSLVNWVLIHWWSAVYCHFRFPLLCVVSLATQKPLKNQELHCCVDGECLNTWGGMLLYFRLWATTFLLQPEEKYFISFDTVNQTSVQ